MWYQSTFISLSDSYHNLASPVKVKQNLCTLMWSWNLCVSIQSFVLSKWASASSFDFLEYLGLKWDQCNKGTWGVGRCDASGTGGTWGALGIKGTYGFWRKWRILWSWRIMSSLGCWGLRTFFICHYLYFWYVFFHLLIIQYVSSSIFFLFHLG